MSRRDIIQENFNKQRVLLLPYFSILIVLIITIGATYLFYKNSVNNDYMRFENEVVKMNARLQNELTKQITAIEAFRQIIESDKKIVQDDGFSFGKVKGVAFLEYANQNRPELMTRPNLDTSNFKFQDAAKDNFDFETLDKDQLRQSIATNDVVVFEVEGRGPADVTTSGFMLMLPVFEYLENKDEASGNFLGFVYYPFKKEAFLNSIYKGSPPEEIGLSLLLEDKKLIEAGQTYSNLQIQRDFHISNTNWSAHFKVLPPFFNASNVLMTVLVPIGGILLGIIVFGFLRFEALTKLELAEIAEELNIIQKQKAELLKSEQKARRLAESSNRMKDEFISMISHEIRTPLNSISGWANILKTENITKDTKQKALRTINKNIKTQSNIIDELLLFSSLTSNKKTLTNDLVKISKILENVLCEINPSAKLKGISLSKESRLNGERIECDEEKLSKAIGNLLHNSIKFTPNGGEIRLIAEKSQGYINLKIKDSGKGIEKEFLPHIFDKFSQADSSTTREFGGLGLGLAISQQIIKLHGGEITVSSEGKNMGTEFDIKLPA